MHSFSQSTSSVLLNSQSVLQACLQIRTSPVLALKVSFLLCVFYQGSVHSQGQLKMLWVRKSRHFLICDELPLLLLLVALLVTSFCTISQHNREHTTDATVLKNAFIWNNHVILHESKYQCPLLGFFLNKNRNTNVMQFKKTLFTVILFT